MKYPRGKHGEIIKECVEKHGAKAELIGTGHIKLTFPNKKEVICSATPSDTIRGWRKLRSTIERIAGIKFERQKHGKYTHRRVTHFKNSPKTTRSANAKALDAKEQRLRALDRQITYWISNPPPASEKWRVDKAIEERHDLAYELRQKGRDVPEFFIEGIEW